LPSGKADNAPQLPAPKAGKGNHSRLTLGEFQQRPEYSEFVNIRRQQQAQQRRSPIAKFDVNTNKMQKSFFTRTGTGTDGGLFEAPPPLDSRYFSTERVPTVQGQTRVADTDAEANGYEILYEAFGEDRTVTGDVTVIVDKPMCNSCSKMTGQTAHTYPNINLTIIEVENMIGSARKRLYDNAIDGVDN